MTKPRKKKVIKTRLTTTFKQLYDKRACKSRYHHLAKALGGIKKYGRTKPINLLTILKHNGLGDFFWVLEVVINDHPVREIIENEGPFWWSSYFWNVEGDIARESRVVSIKKYLCY